MRKNIREFHKGELIRLFACGWQVVEEEPWTDVRAGYTYVAIAILGLRLLQLFKFDWREEFEWMPRREEEI
jgi:hypothetical protein